MGAYDTLPLWPAGHVITDTETGEVLGLLSGSGINGGLLDEVVYERLADQANATTTVVNDNVFAFPVAANARYQVTGMFDFLASATTALLKCQWTVPSGTTAAWVTNAYPSSITATPGTIDLQLRGMTSSLTIGIASTSATTTFCPYARIATGATAGTVQFQFAAAGTGTATMRSGAYAIVKRLA